MWEGGKRGTEALYGFMFGILVMVFLNICGVHPKHSQATLVQNSFSNEI